jgi:phosphatidylinositol alpha-1,6-mannosyltransferase
MLSDLRVFAAIDLEQHGGGVAAASRLCWRALRDRWSDDAKLVTLLDNSRDVTRGKKIAFGARMLALQALGGARWTMFGHLGLARAQAWVPARLQRPYGIFLHGIEVWGPLTAADRRILRRASLRLANSDYTAKRVMRQHPDIGAVLACPLALLPEDELPAYAEGGRRSPIVLMVGRMDAGEAYKGHDEAIDAWPRVAAACPGARLVIAGGGDDAGRLQARAQASPAASSIEFRGFVERAALRALYDEASVFLMPSRGEGFGLVYLEAMAHGLPCIGSREDAAGDVIVDGHTGWLVAQDDRDSIAARLVELLGDAARREAMGEAGRARVRDVLSFDRFRARFVGLLETGLERAAAPVWHTAAAAPRSKGSS